MATIDFINAIEHLKNYKETTAIGFHQKNAVAEVIARLETTAELYDQAKELNDNLLEEDDMIKRSREVLDEYLKSIDTTGWVIRGTTMVSAFDLTTSEFSNPEQEKSVKQLQHLTESIYNNLWGIKSRLNQCPEYKRFNPPGVRDVRNHLITHTDIPASEATIYSFGISTNGPVLRPTKPIGVKAPTDRGLYINIGEFLKEILR